jgi:hypothetical protein
MIKAKNVTKRGPRVAILVVNGFDKGGKWGQYSQNEALDYPWIDLCLRQIDRYSDGWNYELLIFDNTHLEQHRNIMQRYRQAHVLPSGWVGSLGRFADRVPRVGVVRIGRLLERRHPKALDYLVGEIAPDADYVITLDTDSFPASEDWLDVLISRCEEGAAIAGVYRNEMAPTLRPFIHVSGLCMRPNDLRALNVAFGRRQGQDVGQNITESLVQLGREIAPLTRSNKINFHFLMGGLYGDVIYHHGAGSRKAKFHTSIDLDADEQIRVELRNAAFRDIDHLLAVLRGQIPNDSGLSPI